MIFSEFEAALSLVPGAELLFSDGILTWIKPSVPPVTDEQIKAEVIRLQKEYDNNEYQRLRAGEYPPMENYLDGIVKGDQAQIDQYIADCLAVKAKYPKPDNLGNVTTNQSPLE